MSSHPHPPFVLAPNARPLFEYVQLMPCKGHATLPSSCPVCEHSPLSADDCKIHKSLRTTVRVFLRSEEKKKDNLKLKEAKEQAEAKEVTEATPVAEATQEHVEGQDETEAQPPVEATQGEEQGDQPAVGDGVKDGSEEVVSNGVTQVCALVVEGVSA